MRAWIRVDGDYLIISRSDWIYPQADEEGAGARDEARYRAIGRRDGDIVLSFAGGALDAQDVAIMLALEEGT